MADAGDGTEHRLGSDSRGDVRTVAKGGAVQLLGQICQRGLTFFLNAIAIRMIGRSPFGLYRQVVQILAIAAQLGLAGFNYASMRFIARARAEDDPRGVRGAARASITGSVIASALVVVALVAGAEPLAEVFADSPEDVDDFVDLFRLGAIYVPLFALLQVWRYSTQAYKTMVPSVIAGNIVQPVVRFVLGLGALLAGFGVAGLINTLTISTAAGAGAAALYFQRIMTPGERSAKPAPRSREIVRFALPQGGSSLLGIQALGLGVLIVGAYESNAAAGLFAIALVLQGPGNVVLGALLNIWAPMVSDLHSRGEIERLERLYQTITRWVVTFSFPVWAALVLEPDLFVRLFAGDNGAGAEDIVMILAMGNFFYTGTGPTGYVLSMTGRPGINLINSIVGVALYVAGGLWAVPRYGPEGMAVVDAVVTATINSARVIEARVLVGVQPFGRSLLKPLAATAAGAIVLLLWRLVPGDSLWLDGAGVVVAAAVYLGVLKALGMDAEERDVWRQITSRTSKRLRGRR